MKQLEITNKMDSSKFFGILLISIVLIIQCEGKYNLQKLYKAYANELEENVKFSYQNCGPPSDPVKINALSVSPDPLHVPGVITISAAATLEKDLTAPLTVCL